MLAIDPTQLRGYSLFDWSTEPRPITNQRLAAADRHLRKEREKAPLFSDQIAELQPTPLERVEEHNERYTYKAEHWNQWNKDRQDEAFALIATMTPENQVKFMAHWNSSPYPSDPTSMIVQAKKFLEGKVNTEAIVDRSNITDPEKRKRVEKLDRTIATLKDIHSKSTAESGKQYAMQRIVEEELKLALELGGDWL